MIFVTAKDVVEIHESWHGNGGPMSLHEIVEAKNMKANDVYSVLSSTSSKQVYGSRKQKGMRIHSYDPKYGRT